MLAAPTFNEILQKELLDMKVFKSFKKESLTKREVPRYHSIGTNTPIPTLILLLIHLIITSTFGAHDSLECLCLVGVRNQAQTCSPHDFASVRTTWSECPECPSQSSDLYPH